MEKSILVQIGQSVRNLIKYPLYLSLGQSPFRLVRPHIDLVQISLDEVEYQVKLVVGQNHFFQLYNVRVINFFETLYLSQLKTLVPRGILLFKLFYGNYFVFGGDSFENDSKRAVSHGLNDFVLFHKRCKKVE